MKILVADDDAELRALLTFTLERAGFDVFSAVDGRSAVEEFERRAPDFVLLDVNMPAPNGLAVCRELRSRSRLPIMMLTVRDQEDDLVAAFDAGADDYVRKPFSPRTLLARIQALTRRADPLSAEFVEAGTLRLDIKQQALLEASGPTLMLTRLELKVMQLLMASPGRNVTTDRLTLHVWGRNTLRERRMLKQLIYRLRQKLDSHWSTGLAVQAAPGPGYKLVLG